MTKTILTVGLELATADAQYANEKSSVSFLDFDIVIVRPNIRGFISPYCGDYQGKRCLDDTASFRLRECSEHWRKEILQAFEIGKAVIVFLTDKQDVFVATGGKSTSGTGRNMQVTRHVEPFSNYKWIPAPIDPVATTGSSMTLSGQHSEALFSYWKEFSPLSTYKVIISDKIKSSSIITKVGSRPVGSVIIHKDSGGCLILLPDIDFEAAQPVNADKKTFSKKATQFAAKFTSAVVAMVKELKVSDQSTPQPEWSSGPAFESMQEQTAKMELLKAEAGVEAAQRKKEQAIRNFDESQRLKGLLFEKGKLLELCIIAALQILGFSARQYKDGDSEFDVVFESEEGRLLGEAEGKDTKAVNVDKLRQLSMNVHEDLQREEVEKPAKGVLFGNGFRLTNPAERPTQFTEKCISASLSSSTALVATSDLYMAAVFVQDKKDKNYAQLCRSTMISQNGLILFPEYDNSDSPAATKNVDLNEE